MRAVQEQVEISKLEYLAWKYYETDTPDSEIRKNDITEEFWQEFKYLATNKELCNIQLNGGVIKGKSTIMCLLVWEGNNLLNNPMGLDKICADQYEFGKKTQTQIQNVYIGIDEFSRLETTGWNATIESAYLDQFSDVQAQRQIHKIACAPNQLIDKNSEIILRVINKNIKSQTTTCLCYYRMFSPTGETIQLIGHVVFDVSKVIKQKWYEQYRTRKFAKMELIYKEGIYHMRELHFASVVLGSYHSLEPECYIHKPTKDVVEGRAKRLLQEQKIPITSLAIEHIKAEVNSLVVQKYAELTYYKRLKKMKIDKNERDIIINAYKQQKEFLRQDVGRYEKLVEINKKYEAI